MIGILGWRNDDAGLAGEMEPCDEQCLFQRGLIRKRLNRDVWLAAKRKSARVRDMAACNERDCGRERWSAVFLAIPVFAALCTALVAEEPVQGVDLALVPSVQRIGPSSQFTVGLRIHHHEGFHTYWRNPGAVGYATRISWKLPEGFVAGEIRWPVPQMSRMAGHPVFGYKSDVMLLVDIASPAELPGGQLEFHADVSWMACAVGCSPGNKRFSFILPAAGETEADPAGKEIFAKAEAMIPLPLEGWKASMESAADKAKIVFLLTPPADLPDPGALRVFSEDGQISSDPDPLVTKLESGPYRIEVERAKYSPQGAPSLPFVLVAEKPLAPGGRKFGTLAPAYAAAE